MVGIANILALSKLTSETPDAVRKAATLMIVGAKNPLINGIASANIVEEATASAVEAKKAKAAVANAEEAKSAADYKVAQLEAEIELLRPLIAAAADKAKIGQQAAAADGTPLNGYTRMLTALKAGTTVDEVMAKLK